MYFYQLIPSNTTELRAKCGVLQQDEDYTHATTQLYVVEQYMLQCYSQSHPNHHVEDMRPPQIYKEGSSIS